MRKGALNLRKPYQAENSQLFCPPAKAGGHLLCLRIQELLQLGFYQAEGLIVFTAV